MKKIITILLLIISITACCNKKDAKTLAIATEVTSQEKPQEMENIYQFKVKTLTGEDFDFSSLKGKKIMIVNTASKCGLTPQYKDLQKLYETYKDSNFVIIGFPANNFLKQEPGTNKEISEFCQLNYGVTFPMMEKISVKGKDMHPIYQFLTKQAESRDFGAKVTWNFQKYLIDKNGNLAKVISPKTLPTDAAVVDWIKD